MHFFYRWVERRRAERGYERGVGAAGRDCRRRERQSPANAAPTSASMAPRHGPEAPYTTLCLYLQPYGLWKLYGLSGKGLILN